MNRRSTTLFCTPHWPCLVTENSLVILILIVCLVAPSPARCDDADILLKFKESLDNAVALSGWNLSRPPCDNSARRNWDGVMCEGDGRVRGLNLNNMGLGGTLDVSTLAELTTLRVFGAMNNSFEGPLPDFRKLGSLKHLYLSHNKFSGKIPSGHFNGMDSLKKLHLAGNGFVGPIPRSLATLGKLVELMMEDNKFDGRIPEFKQERFTLVNLSNNLLVGQIPLAFSNLNPSSFAGNIGLCGLPLKPCVVDTPQLSTASKVIVGISLAATLAAIVVAVVILTTRKRLPTPEDGPSVAHLKTPPPDELHGLEKGGTTEPVSPECPTPPPADGKRPEQSMKLSFLVESRERFDLNELLKASAEMVGGGVFGSTYKAALGRGPTMAVKRFKHMNNVGREDFHEHMRRLGRLSHRNLLAVVAFHYRKEEKLLVSDFAPNLSLAFHLHGNNSKCPPMGCGSRRRLDWATRLKVVKGVARGLCYLYAELPSLTAPHGHLKSTNVLLDASFEPLLNDYGLLPVVNAEHARKHMVAYKSPEYREGKRITRKTDVWALGILILEILTGKDDGELGAWVESSSAAARIGGGDEEVVFDEGLVRDDEMRKLLRIGMRCCEVDVEKRWDIKEAVKSIEELKEN